MTRAGPMRTSSGSRSTVLPASKKCLGASTWVPVCEPNADAATGWSLRPERARSAARSESRGCPGYTTPPCHDRHGDVVEFAARRDSVDSGWYSASARRQPLPCIRRLIAYIHAFQTASRIRSHQRCMRAARAGRYRAGRHPGPSSPTRVEPPPDIRAPTIWLRRCTIGTPASGTAR